MRLRLSALLLLAFAACEHEDAEDLCVTQQDTYRVTVAVSMREPAKSATEGAAGQATTDPGRVLVSVNESSSIVSCGHGLISESTPGRSIVSNRPVFVDAAGFTLDIDSTIYPSLEIPSVDMYLVLDENENGRCDDGEPLGELAVPRAAQSKLSVELVRGQCPVFF